MIQRRLDWSVKDEAGFSVSAPINDEHVSKRLLADVEGILSPTASGTLSIHIYVGIQVLDCWNSNSLLLVWLCSIMSQNTGSYSHFVLA